MKRPNVQEFTNVAENVIVTGLSQASIKSKKK